MLPLIVAWLSSDFIHDLLIYCSRWSLIYMIYKPKMIVWFDAIFHWFVKVATWICLSLNMDLSKLFYVFLTLCQTIQSWFLNISELPLFCLPQKYTTKNRTHPWQMPWMCHRTNRLPLRAFPILAGPSTLAWSGCSAPDIDDFNE